MIGHSFGSLGHLAKSFSSRIHLGGTHHAESADVRYESEHKKGQFEPAEAEGLVQSNFVVQKNRNWF
jgi:hypothetical protein